MSERVVSGVKVGGKYPGSLIDEFKGGAYFIETGKKVGLVDVVVGGIADDLLDEQHILRHPLDGSVQIIR